MAGGGYRGSAIGNIVGTIATITSDKECADCSETGFDRGMSTFRKSDKGQSHSG